MVSCEKMTKKFMKTYLVPCISR